MESQMQKPEPRSTFPAVFYPNRNHKLLQALAKDISNVVRKQSATPGGGQDSKLVTYDDLIKDPDVMESMKKALDIQDDPPIDEMIDGKPRWAGKTLYDLFKAELDEHTTAKDTKSIKTEENELKILNGTTDESSPSPPPLSEPQVLTIQHLVIEHDRPPILEQPPALGLLTDDNNNHNNDKDKSATELTWISETLVEDQTTSHLRNLQRCDSDSTDTVPDNPDPDFVHSKDEGMTDCSVLESNSCVLAWLDHPGVLALFYCLALLQQISQLGGLDDFMSIIGLILAMISMMAMFFL